MESLFKLWSMEAKFKDIIIAHDMIKRQRQECKACLWLNKKSKKAIKKRNKIWKRYRGVPQGSVLGPLLFLLYVNDLPNWVKANIKMFADDTKLWARICRVEDSGVLQEGLRRVKVWSDEWLLHFNPEKCKVMDIGRTYDTDYYIEQDSQRWKLETVQEEKDLGIITMNDLKFSKQCNEAARKAMNIERTQSPTYKKALLQARHSHI